MNAKRSKSGIATEDLRKISTHDELLAALKDCSEWMRGLVDIELVPESYWVDVINKSVSLEVIIARAEGRQ